MDDDRAVVSSKDGATNGEINESMTEDKISVSDAAKLLRRQKMTK